MTMAEHLEDKFDFEVLTDKVLKLPPPNHNMPIRIYNELDGTGFRPKTL